MLPWKEYLLSFKLPQYYDHEKYKEEYYLKIPENKIQEWKAFAKEQDELIKKNNQIKREAFHKAKEEFLKFIPASLGYKRPNKEHAYVSKIMVRCDYEDANYKSLEYDILNNIEKYKKIKANREAEELKKENNTHLVTEAILYLTFKGKKLGEDFNVSDALELANELAFEIEVDRLTKLGESKDYFMNFEGQNCCDPCEGWNPTFHRCQCGNRRVSFSQGYSHSFKNIDVIAEAY